MKIYPANSVEGEIDIPGDKSISHRAAIFASLSKGKTTITNFSVSEDCRSTLQCLERLGIEIEITGNRVVIDGKGKRGLSKPSEDLDCGNSGTTMRLLAGVLAGQNFESVLFGDTSLSARPMKRISMPLNEMGAKVETADGQPPIRIAGKYPVTPISYDLPVSSAQIKSAILLAGLNGNGVTKVRNPPTKTPEPPSRNHTELMLRYLGARIYERFLETGDGFVHEVSIDGGSELSARDIVVPSDVSSSAFFVTAAIVLKDSDIMLKNIGLNPTRIAFLEVLKGFGAGIEILNAREVNNEPIGDLRVRPGELLQNPNRMELRGDIIANLIDEIPIIAVLGTQLNGGLEIRDAHELRVKESDRIKSVVENLKKMGAAVTEFSDGFRVEKSELKGAKLNSYGDHRIAMSFAIAGLFSSGETEIAGFEAVNVSFPEFFKVLASVVK